MNRWKSMALPPTGACGISKPGPQAGAAMRRLSFTPSVAAGSGQWPSHDLTKRNIHKSEFIL
ncbi:MAG: hypothetical protein ABW185_17110 [Sedimenticola sp.]